MHSRSCAVKNPLQPVARGGEVWARLTAPGGLGLGISRHPGNAQGAPAKPGHLLAKPQSVSGIAELISSGQTAKLGHLCVSVEADAIGPGLAVVDFDAVHVGHGVKAMERTAGKPRRARGQRDTNWLVEQGFADVQPS